MTYRKTKWFVYTVLVGLIPLLARVFVYLFLQETNIEFLFHETDLVIFGLILHITNINELEHLESENKAWKTVQNGISIFFIVMYAVIFSSSCISSVNPGMFNKSMMWWSSLILSVVSFLVSYSIFDRVSKSSIVQGKTTT